MTEEVEVIPHTAVFLHLLGVFCFVGGTITVSVLRFAAINQEKPVEVCTLLRAVRPIVIVVAVGLLVTIAFGFWAVHEEGYNYDSTWLAVTYALVGWMLIVGIIAGRLDRKTRELAEGEINNLKVSDELRMKLNDPLSIGLNSSMLASIIVVIAMMVYRPDKE